jgi:AbiU2
MTQRTADEVKQENIAKMGDALGALYSALLQELAIAHLYWHEYVELFGAKPQRVDLLNRAAPAFFRMLQDELWEMSLLYLARLTDAPHSLGNEDKPNLTIQALLPLTRDHIELNTKVSNLIQTAIEHTKFARDWRNRRIAHRDLRLALEETTKPLADASRAQVNTALKAIADVLNIVAGHYLKSETRFDMAAPRGGALSLLYVMHDGVRLREEREKRIQDGNALSGDFGGRSL